MKLTPVETCTVTATLESPYITAQQTVIPVETQYAMAPNSVTTETTETMTDVTEHVA